MRYKTLIQAHKIYKYAVLAALICLCCALIAAYIINIPNQALIETERRIMNKFYRYVPLIDTPPVCDDDEIEPAELAESIDPLQWEPLYDVPLEYELQLYIYTLCNEFQVPLELVYAIIMVESDFQPALISKTNDYGLMQINKCNHEWLHDKYNITDFLDPYQNVLCGISILATYYHKYEDLNRALMAYNMGAYGAKQAWDKGISSTRYTDKIFKALKEIKEIQ